MKLKIMTFNIQHGVDHSRRLREPGLADAALIDLGRVADTIRQFDPDIVSLNEVRDLSNEPGFSAQTQYLAKACGFPYCFFGEALEAGNRGPYGNALLSRYPLDQVERIMIPDPEHKKAAGHYETRCLIRAEIHPAPGTSLCVMNSHFGLEPEEAESAVDTVLSLTDPARATVFMGDLNFEPDSCYIQRLLRVYRDSAALLPADIKTYPSDAPEIKIDYIMACGPCRFTSAQVPDLVISDHRPYLAEIEI